MKDEIEAVKRYHFDETQALRSKIKSLNTELQQQQQRGIKPYESTLNTHVQEQTFRANPRAETRDRSSHSLPRKDVSVEIKHSNESYAPLRIRSQERTLSKESFLAKGLKPLMSKTTTLNSRNEGLPAALNQSSANN